MNKAPSIDDLVPFFASVNADRPYFLADHLPWLAERMIEFWDHGLRTYEPRKRYGDAFKQALTDAGKEAAIYKLDEAWAAVWQRWRLNCIQVMISNGGFDDVADVRLVSDICCSVARRRHGKNIPPLAFLDFPLKGCDFLGCKCSIQQTSVPKYRIKATS